MGGKKEGRYGTGSGRGGTAGVGALAVGEDIIEGAEVGGGGGLAGVEAGRPAAQARRSTLLALLLDPQCLELDR